MRKRPETAEFRGNMQGLIKVGGWQEYVGAYFQHVSNARPIAALAPEFQQDQRNDSSRHEKALLREVHTHDAASLLQMPGKLRQWFQGVLLRP
jgi:hypothetical protein